MNVPGLESRSRFLLEGLEPRILLSGDAPAPGDPLNAGARSSDEIPGIQESVAGWVGTDQFSGDPIVHGFGGSSDDLFGGAEVLELPSEPSGSDLLEGIQTEPSGGPEILDLSSREGDVTVLVHRSGDISIGRGAVSGSEGSFRLGEEDWRTSGAGIGGIRGGNVRNHFVFETDPVSGWVVQGGGGEDWLTVLTGDPVWRITGDGAGTVGNIRFEGIEAVIGGADNQDTFVIGPGGRLSGFVDGGAGGFDTLVLDGGAFASVAFTAFSPSAGTITRDGNVIEYAGLEPILDNSEAIDRVIGLSDQDDPDATLSSAGVTNLVLSGSTFEGITFARPSRSLTIRGLAGTDVVTIKAISIGGTNLTVEAETILVPAGESITGSGTVSLFASARDPTPITSVSGLTNRLAKVSIGGEILTTGAILVSAEVVRDIDVAVSSLATLNLTSNSAASIDVAAGARLKGETVQL